MRFEEDKLKISIESKRGRDALSNYKTNMGNVDTHGPVRINSGNGGDCSFVWLYEWT